MLVLLRETGLNEAGKLVLPYRCFFEKNEWESHRDFKSAKALCQMGENIHARNYTTSRFGAFQRNVRKFWEIRY